MNKMKNVKFVPATQAHSLLQAVSLAHSRSHSFFTFTISLLRGTASHRAEAPLHVSCLPLPTATNSYWIMCLVGSSPTAWVGLGRRHSSDCGS